MSPAAAATAAVENREDLEVTGNKASDDAQDDDVDMTDEEDGVCPVVEQTEDVDNGLNYLFEE